MKISEKFSLRISNYIKRTIPEKNEEELEIIRYGLEVLFLNLTKIPVLLCLGYFLGVMKYTIVTLIVFGVIRMFAGGIHARKSYTCLLSTSLIIFGIIYLSLNLELSFLWKLLIVACSIIIYFKYSPADTEDKPYVNPQTRKTLKIKSIITVIVYFIISITLSNQLISNIFIHCLWIEGIIISPFTYKIFKRRYKNYELFN